MEDMHYTEKAIDFGAINKAVNLPRHQVTVKPTQNRCLLSTYFGHPVHHMNWVIRKLPSSLNKWGRRSRDKSNMSYTSCPGKYVCSGSPSHASVRTRACVWKLLSHANIAWPEASNGQYMWVNHIKCTAFARITMTYNILLKMVAFVHGH